MSAEYVGSQEFPPDQTNHVSPEHSCPSLQRVHERLPEWTPSLLPFVPFLHSGPRKSTTVISA